MQILNTLLTLLRRSENREKTKEDVLMVQAMDSESKYEVEKSRVYLGYKMLW